MEDREEYEKWLRMIRHANAQYGLVRARSGFTHLADALDAAPHTAVDALAAASDAAAAALAVEDSRPSMEVQAEFEEITLVVCGYKSALFPEAPPKGVAAFTSPMSAAEDEVIRLSAVTTSAAYRVRKSDTTIALSMRSLVSARW